MQTLPADVSVALRAYLSGNPATPPVWGGPGARDHWDAEILRIDLDADFHSLRHSYLTLAGGSGIDLRTLQEVAGHSKPELTARYLHRRLHDLAGAVEKLPNLVPIASADVTPFHLTGTGEHRAKKRSAGCSDVSHFAASIGTGTPFAVRRRASGRLDATP